jgi:molybdopterin converting factor small subunit
LSVKINIPPFFQHLTDEVKLVDVSGMTVGECLNNLMKEFPSLNERLFDGDGKLLSPIEIYINRESTYPEELAKQVKDGDELHIALVLVGG